MFLASAVHVDESLLCTAAIKSPPVLKCCLFKQYAACLYDMMWFDTSFDMNRDQWEQRLNSNCINMNLSSSHWAAESECLECSNLKLKANTWKWMWRLLKLTNLREITVQFIFKFLLFWLGSERLNIWRELLFCEWLEDSCLLQGCRLWSDTLHLANCKPCGAVPFSSPQPINKSSLHLVKGMQIAYYSC